MGPAEESKGIYARVFKRSAGIPPTLDRLSGTRPENYVRRRRKSRGGAKGGFLLPGLVSRGRLSVLLHQSPAEASRAGADSELFHKKLTLKGDFILNLTS